MSGLRSNYRIVGKKLLFLKHKVFQPQLSAPLETKMGVGMLEDIHRAIDGNRDIKNTLNVLLANSLESNISRGRVAEIAMGWNEEKFSFLMVAEVFDVNSGTLIAEEIFQGYTDRVDTAGGNLNVGGVVSLAPDTHMYINRVMSIGYMYDEHGRSTPRFNRTSTVLAETANSGNHYGSDLVLNRPMDMALNYYNLDLQRSMGQGLEIIADNNRYDRKGKLSATGNDVSGRLMSKMINSANQSRLEDRYSGEGVVNGQYESMLSDLVEDSANDYRTLKALGLHTSRTQVTNFTLGELTRFLPMLSPLVFTVESYNDAITKHTNTAFSFNGDSDMGDSSLVDNQLNRFHKKIVPYMFNLMLSYGFVIFSGRITNKTINGEVFAEHTVLINVSETVNNNPDIRNHVMRLFYGGLTSRETQAILSGDTEQAVEIVFDLTITDSVMMIDINGYKSKIKIPSMADGTFSSLVTSADNSAILGSDVKGAVDSILNYNTAGVGYSNVGLI